MRLKLSMAFQNTIKEKITCQVSKLGLPEVPNPYCARLGNAVKALTSQKDTKQTTEHSKMYERLMLLK